jgi:hypothetical protein
MRLSILRALAAVGCFLGAPAWALVPAPCDVVSFGVIIILNTGRWADLGGEAGCRRGELWGQVGYTDHELGLHMRSVQVTAYLYDPAVPNARDICGWGMVKGHDRPVGFRVRVQDNGHPGDRDMVGIVIDPSTNGPAYRVSTRPVVFGYPGGGNIELHAATGAPPGSGFFAPDEARACGGLASP